MSEYENFVIDNETGQVLSAPSQNFAAASGIESDPIMQALQTFQGGLRQLNTLAGLGQSFPVVAPVTDRVKQIAVLGLGAYLIYQAINSRKGS